MATAAMDGSIATAMDSVMVARWKVRQQHNADDGSNSHGGDGRCDGNGNGWRNGDGQRNGNGDGRPLPARRI